MHRAKPLSRAQAIQHMILKKAFCTTGELAWGRNASFAAIGGLICQTGLAAQTGFSLRIYATPPPCTFAFRCATFCWDWAWFAVWGTNFAVIKLGLGQIPPPLLFATLRFVAVILPAIFLVARPAVPWRTWRPYGLLIGVGQFGLMFIAMNGLISPGLASLVVQNAGVLHHRAGDVALGEAGAPGTGCHWRWRRRHWRDPVAHRWQRHPLGLVLMLLAALSWAGGCIVSRQAGRVNMLAYVVWSSACRAAAGGAHAVAGRLDARAHRPETPTPPPGRPSRGRPWATACSATAAWGWLLACYPAATVTPIGAAGAGVRHGRWPSGWAKMPGLEAASRRTGHGRPGAQPAVAAPAALGVAAHLRKLALLRPGPVVQAQALACAVSRAQTITHAAAAQLPLADEHSAGSPTRIRPLRFLRQARVGAPVLFWLQAHVEQHLGKQPHAFQQLPPWFAHCARSFAAPAGR